MFWVGFQKAKKVWESGVRVGVNKEEEGRQRQPHKKKSNENQNKNKQNVYSEHSCFVFLGAKRKKRSKIIIHNNKEERKLLIFRTEEIYRDRTIRQPNNT